jgi:hypothetical protein
MPLSGTVHMGDSSPNPVGVSLGMDQTLIVYANASGTFSLPSISPGDHALQVIRPPGWIVQSILQGGLAVRDEKISSAKLAHPSQSKSLSIKAEALSKWPCPKAPPPLRS